MIYRSRRAPGSKIAQTYSKSYYETLRYDYMHIFRTVQFDLSPYLKKKVSPFMAGMKSIVAK